jgi:hypothetical protein
VAWTFDLGDLPVQPEVRSVLSAVRDRLEQAGIPDAGRKV